MISIILLAKREGESRPATPSRSVEEIVVRAKSFVLCTILVASIARVAAANPVVAPADEYFGRMKLSILGIGNIMHDTKLREAYDPSHAADNYTKLSSAEDALEDWAAKYPQDTWLPGKAYYMSHEFWAMNTPDGDRAAERCRALLLTRYATSKYSSRARTEVAAMFQSKATTAIASAASTASGSTATTGSTASTAGGTTAASATSATAVNPGAAPPAGAVAATPAPVIPHS
jgi:hypothetical protein